MCGITGLIHSNSSPVDRSVLESMNRAITSRGPDAEGYWIQEGAGLGHRRLSIIDLEGGAQPMTSPDGRYTIVFNGEIYNFASLKADLEKSGEFFSTHSDTEVLLKLYVQSGKNCLAKLNGMFAFAIWDAREKSLFAARDRMGKKPFYYWKTPNTFAFASECKAFLKHPQFSKRLNPQAISSFFQYEYVPAPLSIYDDVFKLPAAHCLTFKNNQLTIERYWEIPFTDSPLDISEAEAASLLVNHLDRAVERRLVSDVPLGVFLSGGIDSSAIVAMMARHRPGNSIKTFSIGFQERSYDETPYADLIAKTFKTDHHQEVLSPNRLHEIIPEVTGYLDEPFADYSILPTYLLARFTRQKVTVALGGDGGDELFAGYPTFYADRLANTYRHVPGFARKMIAKFGRSLPVSHADMSFDFKLNQFLYGASFPPIARNQVWLGAFHAAEQSDLFTPEMRGQFGNFNPLQFTADALQHCPSTSPENRLLYFYQKFYLCDDILVKADRASMANSLEVRAPFLDVELVEYASQLPYRLKLKGKQTKYILKKALEGILPDSILYRPKKGFGIPMAEWLTGPLKNNLLETLHPNKIRKAGIFNPIKIQNLIDDHLSQKRNNRKQLFALLMFEWWREKYA